MAIIYISSLCTLRAHLKQPEIWRKTVDKRDKTQRTPGRTRTYTNAHLHHVDAHSLVRCPYCPLAKQWCEQIVKTPWWTHKNMLKAKHINFNTYLQVAFRTLQPNVNIPTPSLAKYALKWNNARFHCHSGLQRILNTLILPSQSETTLVERLQVRTWKDKDEHLHGRW